jgi:hypothetical protein
VNPTGTNSNRPPPGSAIVSLILQRSVIELFAAYGVSVAPVRTEDHASHPNFRPLDHLVGMVQVTSPARRGTLTLSTSPATLTRTRQGGTDVLSQLDWMRELTNQFGGRVKAKFTRYGLTLYTGLPMALSGSAMDRHQVIQRGDLVLVFTTLKDQILATLSGGFDDTGLVLRGDISVANEGEVILF